MKHLCYSRYIFLIIFVSGTLFASLSDKSATIFYGKNISYSMVGIHDYIIVKPENMNTYSHGFKVYKNKIYARVVLKNNTKEITENVSKNIKAGFLNFYFDINSNSLNVEKLKKFINNFHSKYPKMKIIVNSRFDGLDKLYNILQAVVVDARQNITRGEKTQLKRMAIDIIKIVHEAREEIDASDAVINKIKSQGMIPYITTSDMNIYGKSSKNAIKREIFTLIDESKDDRTLLGAHQVGALPLEYLGYIQKLYDINQGLPDTETMGHYAGVVVWLRENYKNPSELMRWTLNLNKMGIKVAFANNFGFAADDMLLKPLDIEISDGDSSASNKRKIIYKDSMAGFEIEPSLGGSSLYMHPNDAKEILIYEDKDGLQSTPAAITKWGGYAIGEALLVELNEENVWVINPFEFFSQALRLKKLIVPDATTENGNRLFFTHVDGDGMVNRVESNPELFSGDMILDKILKVYKIPHSISLIGAEISPKGLYPEFSPRVMEISRQMYALDNVEPATHTFTHPFFWEKIKNGHLDRAYRLKPKGYHFSLYNELSGTLKEINEKLLAKNANKVAQTVFWSGDCAPRVAVLDYVYKHNILNINGGDTTISNVNPWLTLVAPLGLERGDYYQIYTGAQNENVFTNDWLGPFWGFKRVVQTFKLTNSPRRLKPIDVYYHLYSGSKAASLNALKYIFNWSIKQEILPIFTSEYIPKAMDYFTVSMAQEGDQWLVDGMKNLKTLRVENSTVGIDFKKSQTVLGVKQFENHTYISLSGATKHRVQMKAIGKKPNRSYLIAANAKVISYKNGLHNQQFNFEGYIGLKLDFYLKKGCKIESKPKASKVVHTGRDVTLYYDKLKKAKVNVICRP